MGSSGSLGAQFWPSGGVVCVLVVLTTAGVLVDSSAWDWLYVLVPGLVLAVRVGMARGAAAERSRRGFRDTIFRTWRSSSPPASTGIADEDIEHAIANAVVAGDQEDGKVLYLGPDRAANLLEIVTVARATVRRS